MLSEATAGTRPLRLMLTALLLLQGLAGFLPGPLLWSSSHLAYAPAAARLAVPILGLAALWTPFGRLLARAAAPAGRALLGRRSIAYGVIPGAGMVLFWLLRSRLHFLGDGWLLGELTARGIRFHGFDLLAYHLHARLFALLGWTGEAAAFRLFALSSIALGGLYLAAAAWSSRRLAALPEDRLLLWGLLVLCAPVQMFMGYVEAYALLTVLLLIFLAALVLHYRGGAPGWLPAGIFGLAVAVHLDALFLAPLLVGLVVLPPSGSRSSPARRLLGVAMPALAGPALAAVILAASGYDAQRLRIDFLEAREGRSMLVSLRDDLLSLRHWKDLANLLLLLAPVALAMILARLRGLRAATGEAGGRAEGRDPAARRLIAILLAACLALALLMAFVHMRLGVARDWDLFAASALVFPITAFVLWRPRPKPEAALAGTSPESAEERAVARASFAVLVLVPALLLTAPWFWLNAGEMRSLARFRDVIADLPRFPQAYAHEEIGKYFRKAGDLAAARREYETCTSIHPTNPRFHALLGGLLYNEGEAEAALAEFVRVLDLDSTYVLALEMTARIHAERGRSEEALRWARRLAGRREETASAAVLHAVVAAREGRFPEAADAYERALRLEPENLDTLERLAGVFLLAHDYARAEQAFRAVLARDPRSAPSVVGLVTSLWMPCEEDPRVLAEARADGRLGEALRLLDLLLGASPDGAGTGPRPLGVSAGRPAAAALGESALEELRAWRTRIAGAARDPASSPRDSGP